MNAHGVVRMCRLMRMMTMMMVITPPRFLQWRLGAQAADNNGTEKCEVLPRGGSLGCCDDIAEEEAAPPAEADDDQFKIASWLLLNLQEEPGALLEMRMVRG